MGASRWSDDHYTDRVKLRTATNSSTFAYHDTTSRKSATDWKAHASLDPKGVKVRESRDSAEHPNSTGIAVLFDVTGSMRQVPQIMQKNLCKLMGLLLRKNYVSDPQILVGAIGDATSDRVPLQVGQFESGIEIENDLTNIFLEGNGGGQQSESYELAMYFLARHTSMDCLEKRGKKGYCFIIGDEMARDVSGSAVQQVIGDSTENIKLEDMVRELQTKFEVYYILPKMTSYYDDPKIETFWRKLLVQNFIKLDDPEGICELIGSTIGICEGQDVDAITEDLTASGTDLAVVNSVKNAVKTVRGARRDVALPTSSSDSGVAVL